MNEVVLIVVLLILISGILSIWGSCLVARLVANRLELGLFRRKVRRSGMEAAAPTVPLPKRRSTWWVMVALVAMAIGALPSFLVLYGDSLDSGASSGRSRDWETALTFSSLSLSLGLAAGLALVGFRFDPHLGRRRCPKCWYDLSATKSLLCPECGHEARSERGLYKTRRSRVTIALACLMLLTVPITMRVIETYRSGWIGLIPTTAMVLLVEELPDSVTGFSPPTAMWVRSGSGTLYDRLDRRDVWFWQHEIMNWRLRSTALSSTDPKAIYRALGRLDGSVGDDFAKALASRLDLLIPALSDADPVNVEAAAGLLHTLSYSVGSLPADAQTRFKMELLAAKPTLMTLGVGSVVNTSYSALQLLATPTLIGSLDAADVARLEAHFTRTPVPPMDRYFMAAAFGDHLANPLIADMFLRTLDFPDPVVRKECVSAILGRSTDPRVIDRAIASLREPDPSLGAMATGPAVRMKSPRLLELREGTLKRFSVDQFMNPGFWEVVTYWPTILPYTEEEHAILRPGVIRALGSGDLPSVGKALAFMRLSPDRSAELREALDSRIVSMDGAHPHLEQAREVQRVLFPDAAP
jgi:hypothetical protein